MRAAEKSLISSSGAVAAATLFVAIMEHRSSMPQLPLGTQGVKKVGANQSHNYFRHSDHHLLEGGINILDESSSPPLIGRHQQKLVSKIFILQLT